MITTSTPVGFTLALSRFVALLQGEVRADEHRESLRALVQGSQEGNVELELRDRQLTLNGRPLPLMLESVDTLIERFRLHRIRSLTVRRNAMSGELADLARMLATPPDAQGAAGIGLWNVQLVRWTPAEEAGERPWDEPDIASREAAARLDEAIDETLDVALATVVTLLAEAAEAGRLGDIGALLPALDRGAQQQADRRKQNACETALSRAATPSVVRQFAHLLPVRAERDADLELLRRLGDVGAHALIAQLMAAEDIDERRVYFDAIVTVRESIPTLIDALGHSQWFVVRNAASLLGEMRAVEADEALAPLLGHRHERVRQAAATALSRLATPRAKRALRLAIYDVMPEIRMRAAEAMADNGLASPLAQALDNESDDDVRLGIIAALGRLGTPAAVQRLIRASGPGGNGAGTTPVPIRVAALEALAAARGTNSLPMLRELTADTDHAIRDAARRLIAGVAVQ